MSAYLLVSLHTSLLHQPQLQPSTQPAAQPQAIALKLVQHPDWNQASSWKQVLNNLRLVIQPSVILNLLQPWLNLFPIPRLSAGLECLIALMNRFLAACHATSHTQISTFLLPRVIEERYSETPICLGCAFPQLAQTLLYSEAGTWVVGHARVNLGSVWCAHRLDTSFE